MVTNVTEKMYTISVNGKKGMERNSYSLAIRNRVKHAKVGTVFAMVDFADLAPNNAANRVVTRLVSEGVLVSVIRGIYQKPKYSTLLKENVLPGVDEVAAALARKCGWTIRADGDTALNQLGLSMPRNAKIFILKNLQNSALTSSSFAHPRKLSYRCFIGA